MKFYRQSENGLLAASDLGIELYQINNGFSVIVGNNKVTGYLGGSEDEVLGFKPTVEDLKSIELVPLTEDEEAKLHLTGLFKDYNEFLTETKKFMEKQDDRAQTQSTINQPL